MFRFRFGEDPPAKRSVNQLRGIEGVRVRKMYQLFARRFNVAWKYRKYDPATWAEGDLPNRCLSSATSCLYGVTEAAVLAAGYMPAIGFIHSGKPLSFVYDVADLFKFETVVPVAFKVAARKPSNSEQAVRIECREAFRSSRLLERIIPTIEEILSAGELPMPEAPDDAQPPAIQEQEGLHNDGHRG